MRLHKFLILLILIPNIEFSYPENHNYGSTIEFMQDSRGECVGEHYTLIEKTAYNRNYCEQECERNPDCEGFMTTKASDPSWGPCHLKKNIDFCPEGDWKSVSTLVYYAKPLEINFAVPNFTKNYPTSDTKKYCLHVAASPKAGDKVVSKECDIYGHYGQTFTFKETQAGSKQYQVKHIDSSYCLELVEYILDDNPLRLWECDSSGQKERQLFKFTLPQIPKGLALYSPFKTRLVTRHFLAGTGASPSASTSTTSASTSASGVPSIFTIFKRPDNRYGLKINGADTTGGHVQDYLGCKMESGNVVCYGKDSGQNRCWKIEHNTAGTLIKSWSASTPATNCDQHKSSLEIIMP